MFKIFLIFFLLIGSSFANERAEDLWEDANRYYSQAEGKVRKSSYDEAAVLFKTSLDKLKKIRYEFPKWNPSVVDNRIKGCSKRMAANEELILQSIKNYTKQELIERLKITQIARAKFSKAMMILYEDLNRTKGELDVTQKALDRATEAAGSRVAGEAHLDKLTFENLKLRKSLRDMEAKLLTLKGHSSQQINSDKAEAEVLKYKKLQAEIVQKEESLKKEKAELATQLKTLSIKYSDLLQDEKSSLKQLKVVQELSSKWEKKAKAEREAHLKTNNAVIQAKEELKLVNQRLKDSKFREAESINALTALKKNGGNQKMMANLTERNAELIKENTRLRKVEIDLTAKNRTLSNNFEKNVLLLKNHVDDSAKTSLENDNLKSMNERLEGAIKRLDDKIKSSDSKNKSLENDVKSLNSQISILQKVVDDYKKNSIKKSDDTTKVDEKLLAAYEKKDKENQAKIVFLEKSLRKLEVKNKTLQEENIAGDEEVIKKYIQTKDELRSSKLKVTKLYERLKTFEGGVDPAIQESMLQEEIEANNKLKKFNDLLFQASRQKDSAAAVALYTKALSIQPKNFDALLRLGMHFYDQGRFHDAAIHLGKAFYIKPDDQTMLLALGISQIELGRLELAVSALSRLVGKYPEDAQAHLQLGTVLQGLGWYEAAIGHLEKAFSLDNESGETAFNLAVCYLALQDPDVVKARIYYQKALELGVVKDPVLEKYFSVN